MSNSLEAVEYEAVEFMNVIWLSSYEADRMVNAEVHLTDPTEPLRERHDIDIRGCGSALGAFRGAQV